MKFAAAAWAILMGSFALGQTAPIVKAWDATNVTWQHVDPDGTKHSILEGDKDAPGKAFTYAVFVPAGAWDNFTHSHNQDARVAVVSGALLLAVGSNPDKKGARSYPAGSFVFVPANMEHTMGADVDTIIIGTAIGPWKTHDNEAPHHH
ncbi:MAG: cupin domain-containing protein [Terriglobales bacterium]